MERQQGRKTQGLGWWYLGQSHWWMVLLFWLGGTLPGHALELRVAIAQGQSQVKVASSTKGIVRDAWGKPLGEVAGLGAVQAKSQIGQVVLGGRWQGSRLWLEPQQGGYVWIGDRWYRGRTLLLSDQGGITAVNYVNLEEYLYSVLGGEMNGSWPQEALKAQAVAARSFALYRRQHRGQHHYDLGNTQVWQVYRGLADEAPGTLAAVRSTAGQVLVHNGSIIEAVFHSSSGGHTENVEDVWTRYVPYLRGVVDYDHIAPVFHWRQQFSAQELSRRLTGVGAVQALTPVKTSPYGRIMTMKVLGEGGSRILKGNRVRRALDLKSARFRVSQPQPQTFVLEGYGFGHGLGLSQWGARNLAQHGYKYQQILSHYYQNTNLAQLQVQAAAVFPGYPSAQLLAALSPVQRFDQFLLLGEWHRLL